MFRCKSSFSTAILIALAVILATACKAPFKSAGGEDSSADSSGNTTTNNPAPTPSLSPAPSPTPTPALTPEPEPSATPTPSPEPTSWLIEITAHKTYKPSQSYDGIYELTETMHVRIPQAVEVTSGHPGAHKLTINFAGLECIYLGNNSNAYVFDKCKNSDETEVVSMRGKIIVHVDHGKTSEPTYVKAIFEISSPEPTEPQ